MRPFISEFNDKKNDVTTFLNVLVFIDSIATNKHQSLTAENHLGTISSYQPTRQTQQVLRAMFYLVLYNIMEATANSIISAVKDTINDEQVPLNSIRQSILDLFVSGTLKDLESSKKIINKTSEILRHIQDNTTLLIDKLGFNTSGSVNFDYMQKIVVRIGCAGSLTVNIEELSWAMNRAKEYRNKLAHGNWSYSTSGSLLVIDTIKNDCDLVLTYLSETLTNLDNYLNEKKYLK